MIYRRRRSVIDFEWNDPTVREPAHTHSHTPRNSDKDEVSVWLPIRERRRWRRCLLQDGWKTKKKYYYIIILIGKTLTLDGTTTGFRIFFSITSLLAPASHPPLFSPPRETVLYDDHWRLRGGRLINPIFPILSLPMYCNKVITLLYSRCIKHTSPETEDAARAYLQILYNNSCIWVRLPDKTGRCRF